MPIKGRNFSSPHHVKTGSWIDPNYFFYGVRPPQCQADHIPPSRRKYDATYPIPHRPLWLSALLTIQDCKSNGCWQRFETAAVVHTAERNPRHALSLRTNSIANFYSIDSAIPELLWTALFAYT